MTKPATRAATNAATPTMVADRLAGASSPCVHNPRFSVIIDHTLDIERLSDVCLLQTFCARAQFVRNRENSARIASDHRTSSNSSYDRHALGEPSVPHDSGRFRTEGGSAWRPCRRGPDN